MKKTKIRLLSKEELGVSSALFVPKISALEFANSIYTNVNSPCSIFLTQEPKYGIMQSKHNGIWKTMFGKGKG